MSGLQPSYDVSILLKSISFKYVRWYTVCLLDVCQNKTKNTKLIVRSIILMSSFKHPLLPKVQRDFGGRGILTCNLLIYSQMLYQGIIPIPNHHKDSLINSTILNTTKALQPKVLYQPWDTRVQYASRYFYILENRTYFHIFKSCS